MTQNELNIQRNLKNPQYVLINNKKQKINDFHAAIEEIGYLNSDNIQIHALFDKEIMKLGYLVGDDLWSMLMKIITCEELIVLAEQSSGVVKKRILKRTYDSLTSTVCQVLPKKVQLRDRIHHQVLTQSNLYTYLHIITERLFVILNYQAAACEEKFTALVDDLKKIFLENHDKRKCMRMNYQMIENCRNMRAQIRDKELAYAKESSILMMKNVNVYRAPTLDNFTRIADEGFELINKVFSSNEHLKFDEDIGINYDVASWKLLLKQSDDNKIILKTILKVAKEKEEIIRNELENIDKGIEEEKSKCVEIEELEQEHLEHLSKSTKYFGTIYSADKSIDKLKHKIINTFDNSVSFTFHAFIPSNYHKALVVIEDLVKGDSDLAKSYIGPVYKKLNVTNCIQLDNKMWQQIQEVALTILFKTAVEASMMAEYLVRSRVNCQLTIIALDEFRCDDNLETTPPITDNRLKFAKTLIKPNLSEELNNVLPYLLHKFIFIENGEHIVFNDNELNKWNATFYDDFVSTTYENGNSISVVNQLPKTSKHSAIKSAQNMHVQIKKRKQIMKAIKEKEDTVKQAKLIMELEETEIEKSLNQKRSQLLYGKARIMMSMQEKFFYNSQANHIKRLEDLLDENLDEVSEEDLKTELSNYEFCASNPPIPDIPITQPLDIVKIFTHNKDNCDLFGDVSSKCRKDIKDSTDSKLKLINEATSDLEKSFQSTLSILKNTLDINQTIIPKESETMRIFKMQELCNEFGKLFARRYILKKLIKSMDNKINQPSDENDMIEFKKDAYEKFKNKETEIILNEASRMRESLISGRLSTGLRVTHFTHNNYKALVDSIIKVRSFAEEREVFAPLEVKKRAFPLMNALVVKMLRDTVYHFKTTYNAVLSDYLQQSSLFFYTHGNIQEIIEDDQFSWNCFDMSRIKSIDFTDKWITNNRSKMSIDKVKQIKGFLLILHIINYISIFKFVIISTKIFKELDNEMKEKLRVFLQAISPSIQVIIYVEPRGALDDEDELMEISQ